MFKVQQATYYIKITRVKGQGVRSYGKWASVNDMGNGESTIGNRQSGPTQVVKSKGKWVKGE